MAGILASALAGGMVGGGQAWQVQARDEALNQQRMTLEEQRAKLETDKQMAVEAIRHKNSIALKDYEISEPYTKGILARESARVQAAIDLENNPDNVAKKVATTTALDDAKSYELAPGQKRMRGGEVVGENTRKTTAEVYEDAYASGAKGAAGRLPDGYVKEAADIDKTQQRLDESILDLRKKAATDSASDPTTEARITQEIRQMQRESALLDRKKHIAGIRHGVITAEQEAARLGPRLRNLEEVNSVLREASEIVGVDWANKLADALSRAGAVQGADVRDREASRTIQDSAPDENAVESRRNQGRTGILSGNVLSPSWKPTFATEPELSPLERQQQEEFDARRVRGQASEARTTEMRARIQPDIIARMSAQEAQKILDTYGTELPGRARAALNAKLR